MSNYVVVNDCFGGFGLSEEALEKLSSLKGRKIDEYQILSGDPENDEGYSENLIPRHDPDLVSVVQTLGSDRASDKYAKLRVVEIKNQYIIREYDGLEELITPETVVWNNV